jgi:hypothetical protein
MAAEFEYFNTVWANIPDFSGNTDLYDAHKKMEDLVDYGVWLDDFEPASAPQRRVIDSLLRFLDSQGVCCIISGLYPAFMAGRIELSIPASTTARFKPSEFWARLYIAFRQSAHQTILGTGPRLW